MFRLNKLWHAFRIILSMNENINKVLDNKPVLVYNATNSKGEKEMKRQSLKLSLDEKREIVQTIDKEVKATDKSVYKICKEYGLKLHHYYNWSKLILKTDAARFPKKKESAAVTFREHLENLRFKKMQIAQKAPQVAVPVIKSDKQIAVVFGDITEITKLLNEMT